jgi:hypothetical protein
MIPKSGDRFSEKIMLKKKIAVFGADQPAAGPGTCGVKAIAGCPAFAGHDSLI